MNNRYFNIDVARFGLLVFVFLMSFGLPIYYGELLRYVSEFATIAFFIFSGFLNLRYDDGIEEKIVRAIKRTAIFFGITFVIYIALNTIYFALNGQNFFAYRWAAFHYKRFWFEWIVFNSWPIEIGTNIWFIHCLLYGYIAIYILNKLNLLKYDWLIFLICIAITLAAGELTAFTGFNLFGYRVLPPMVLTKSLPFLLLGRMIGQYRPLLFRVKTIIYYLLVPVFLFFSIIEIMVLGTNGLLATTSYTMCGIFAAFCFCTGIIKSENATYPVNFFVNNLGMYVKVFYVIHQPVGLACFIILQMFFASFYQRNMILAPVIMCGMTYILSILIGMAVAFVGSKIKPAPIDVGETIAEQPAVESMDTTATDDTEIQKETEIETESEKEE